MTDWVLPQYKIQVGLDGKHYAVFANGCDAEDAAWAFEGCLIACFGQYENAYQLTSDWWHRSGRTKAGNNIG